MNEVCMTNINKIGNVFYLGFFPSSFEVLWESLIQSLQWPLSGRSSIHSVYGGSCVLLWSCGSLLLVRLCCVGKSKTIYRNNKFVVMLFISPHSLRRSVGYPGNQGKRPWTPPDCQINFSDVV